MNKISNEFDNETELNKSSVKNLMGFIEKYDKLEQSELIASWISGWLSSFEQSSIDSPSGIISQMVPISENHIIILMPYDEKSPNLDYRILHQIVRDLTIGIYAFNQNPNLVLDANYDESTTCTMPPGYTDTKLGQIMINTDYWLKALWHGAYFPREKRTRFSKTWRSLFSVKSSDRNAIDQFITFGLQETCIDPEFENSYDEFTMEEENYFKTLTQNEVKEEINFFMNNVDDLGLQLTMFLNKCKQYKNLFEIDCDYYLNACVKTTFNQIDNIKFERLKRRLNRQETFLRKNFAKKKEVRNNLNIMKLVSFLVPLLIGLKKRMKIPDLNNLLPFMSGDDVKTERELPPLIIPSDFKCKTFQNPFSSNSMRDNDKYFHLHGGIQFELETPSINHNCAEDYKSIYNIIQSESSEKLKQYLKSEAQLQEYPVPVIELNGKRYYSIRVNIENYKSSYPKKPFWLNKLTNDLNSLQQKRLPIDEISIYDLFKKFFGFKTAAKNKNSAIGLKASSSRGIISIYYSLAKKTNQNRLNDYNENGLTSLHYAAIYNRPSILNILHFRGVEFNTKQLVEGLSLGPMALHYAARCSSLDSMSFLLCNYAISTFVDNNGWMPIHHAAFVDNVPGIKIIFRRHYEAIELLTRGENKWTPILLASSAGSLQSIVCLIDLGANLAFKDDNDYNLIHIAAHKNHTNIIEYFIEANHSQLKATSIVISMLKSSKEIDKESAVRSLKVMTSKSAVYANPIQEAGGVEQLVSILRENAIIQQKTLITQPVEIQVNKSQQILIFNTLSVLCNISDKCFIRESLSKIGDITTILSKLIEPIWNGDVQSRATILIADISAVSLSIKTAFEEKGCCEKLARLLQSDAEDLLVNTINAIEALSQNNETNKDKFAQMNTLITLCELLVLKSDLVQAASAAAISSILTNSKKNQYLALNQGVPRALTNLLKTRNVMVQLNIALALESLATDNNVLCRCILELGGAEGMINLLRRMHFISITIKESSEDWSIVVCEQAARTLWSLAGSEKLQQRLIAEKIGILEIITMLLSKSEGLQYVACKCIIAFVSENLENQLLIAKENTIEILLKLLKNEKKNLKVVLVILQTISSLCVDIAMVNNKKTQLELIDKGAFDILIPLLENHSNNNVKIGAFHGIACILLGNPISESFLCNKLKLNKVLDLLNEEDTTLRLSAGRALSILAYNNINRQFEIKLIGGIPFSLYENLIKSKIEMEVCYSCFQIIILAKVFNDQDKIWITAEGITRIIDILNSKDEEVVIQAISNLASLAHTRAGITDAMVQSNIIDILSEKLFSKNKQIRFVSAVTLGYLTFNRTASRLLIHNCRNIENLYKNLIENLRDDSIINEEFLHNYDQVIKLGLPKVKIQTKVRFIEPIKSNN